MNYRTLDSQNLAGQRVLIRQDLNVPVSDGKVTSDARIRASLPTLQKCLAAGAKVMVMSHLGRPKEGHYDAEHSLAPVAVYLTAALGRPVPLITDWLENPPTLQDGEIVLLENVRFNVGEKKDDPILSEKMGKLCDIYVMDAFGTAHRAEASTHGVAKYAPIAVAGPLLDAELQALGRALAAPKRPLAVIVGGSKVSTKLDLLNSLKDIADQIIIGGGITNTFLAANGYPVGKSLYESDMLDTARNIQAAIQARGGEIALPEDVVVATEFSPEARPEIRPISEVEDDEMILDIGPKTRKKLAAQLANCQTIVWNGPVGVFEYANFAGGTKALAEAIANSGAFTLAGGGDTLAAIDKFQVSDKLSYISTGGGAFLEFLEGKTLPAVAALMARA